MADERFIGQDLYLAFNGTDLSTRYKSFEESEEMGLVDQSAGPDTARTYLTTLEDGTASAEILAEQSGSAEWNALDKGTEGTLEWGPEGTASGKMRHWVNAIVKSRKKAIVHEDIVKISVEFQMSGAVTDTEY